MAPFWDHLKNHNCCMLGWPRMTNDLCQPKKRIPSRYSWQMLALIIWWWNDSHNYYIDSKVAVKDRKSRTSWWPRNTQQDWYSTANLVLKDENCYSYSTKSPSFHAYINIFWTVRENSVNKTWAPLETNQAWNLGGILCTVGN